MLLSLRSARGPLEHLIIGSCVLQIGYCTAPDLREDGGLLCPPYSAESVLVPAEKLGSGTNSGCCLHHSPRDIGGDAVPDAL